MPSQTTAPSNSHMTSEQLAVLSTFSVFIEALNNISASQMHAVILPLGSCTLQRETEPKIEHWTLDAVVDRIIAMVSAGTKVEETIEKDDLEVKVDGTLGMIWAKYKVFMDGKEALEGRNVVSLAKTEEGWRICGIVDTGRAVVGKE